ncbi:UNVERIFIED_CONTAM: Cysteine proteinase inhibitor 1 [Sesamum latifolium]|uniref:Cysteine proteinase inhibitor 1 n=1 Tax=Sesamum latifolium TaxID=2727402 RepID=A0AAW2WR82_9LAMI
MAYATGPIVFVVLLVAGSIASATSEGQELLRLGGWRPISNPRDHKVLEIAEFAVREHNKLAKTNLKLQSVISGAVQVVGGRNYRLVVSAMDGNSPTNYLALVYEKPWQHLKILIGFQKVATALS